MAKAKQEHKQPLVHIVKRDAMPFPKALAIRAAAIVIALLICGVIAMVLADKNPIMIYGAMIKGAFGSPNKIWDLLQNVAILLCISLAVTPAFKMKFWNCGAEGQVLIGGLGAVTVMYFLGGKVAYPILIVLMVAASIAAGIIWALIPALFKAQWNTNETLFTLMMNYIATQLVAFCLKAWVKSGSGVLSPMEQYGLPKIGHRYLLNILIVAALTAGMYIYLKYSKQGYEISVVGESEKTAKYIGINVKKVIIRTLLVSGAVCGIAGLLLVGGTDHTITTSTVGGRGFTAIMVSWLAKFNPIVMVLTSFLVVFLQKGAMQMQYSFNVNSSVSDIITAIILFFIIGCEFFINYKVVFRKKENKPTKEEENKSIKEGEWK